MSVRLSYIFLLVCVLDSIASVTMLLRNVCRRLGRENRWFWQLFKCGNCGNFSTAV